MMNLKNIMEKNSKIIAFAERAFNKLADYKIRRKIVKNISFREEFSVMAKHIDEFVEKIENPKLKTMFKDCFYNTIDTTVNFWKDGTTYVITGDIDAMWLRDSSAQVTQYLQFAGEDEKVAKLIRGLIKRQLAYIALDPYANSFGKIPEGNFPKDECEKRPYVWERKFELDSLCYPLRLMKQYYEVTGDKGVFDSEFLGGLKTILGVFECEQDHQKNSTYYHYRPDEAPELSVPNKGRGGEVKVCGLVWSGYRPSDDPCVYGYLIPGNMFVSSIMKELVSLGDVTGIDEATKKRMLALAEAIDKAIEEYGIVDHPDYGKIYAYEVDGLGGVNLMDDANVPSLLSIPYMGYKGVDDPIYKNTRRFILSENNPYYFKGKCITGVGSPHTPKGYVWPISLMIQGLTSESEEEVNGVLKLLMENDAGTGFMHEGVYCDDHYTFTRSWFAWANSLFSTFILKKKDKINFITEG